MDAVGATPAPSRDFLLAQDSNGQLLLRREQGLKSKSK
jgi:hypothetical protein